MSRKRDSKRKAPAPAEHRPRTVLPVAKGPPREAPRPAEPIPLLPPKKPVSTGRRLGATIFSLTVLAGVFAGVLVIVNKLDDEKRGLEVVEHGHLYWLPDGVVAVQAGPEPGQTMYYLVEAPRESNPRVTLSGSGITVRAFTDEGVRTLSKRPDWTSESPVALLTFKNYYREAVDLEGEVEVLDKFVASGGEGAAVSQLLYYFRAARPEAVPAPRSPVPSSPPVEAPSQGLPLPVPPAPASPQPTVPRSPVSPDEIAP